MLPIRRGQPPSVLAAVRRDNLVRLRGLGRAPKSAEIDGYGPPEVRSALRKAQHGKCAWCEDHVREKYNDLDHYRPKAEADRTPGSTDRHGYWWLAYDWDNLLYSCPDCNRPPAKGIQFPLDRGSRALQPEQSPPGDELPLLLDPADCNTHPASHIGFRDSSSGWRAEPRAGSPLGALVIRTIKLNAQGPLESRTSYINATIVPQIDALRRALGTHPRSPHAVWQWEWYRALDMLRESHRFVVASADAFRLRIPDGELPEGFRWPAPEDLPWRG